MTTVLGPNGVGFSDLFGERTFGVPGVKKIISATDKARLFAQLDDVDRGFDNSGQAAFTAKKMRALGLSDAFNPDVIETRNYYTALIEVALPADETIARSAAEYLVKGSSSNLAKIATSILNHEHSRDRRPGNCRLNCTVPDSPEHDEDDTQKGASKGKPAGDLSEGGNVPGATAEKRTMSKADKRALILKRVSTRLSAFDDPQLGYLQWVGLSSATVPWKMAVYHQMFPSGSICVGGIVLKADVIRSLCLSGLCRWGVADYSETAGRFITAFSAGDVIPFDVPLATCDDGIGFWLRKPFGRPSDAVHEKYTTWLSKFALATTSLNSESTNDDD